MTLQQPKELWPAEGEGDITLQDLLRFLKSAHKTILGLGILGLVISASYLFITPNQYEAIAQISMAQVSNSNDVVGVNIEEPSLLMTRLSSPTSFTPEVLAACNVGISPGASTMIASVINFAQPKGVPNIIELKTLGHSPDEAGMCAHSIYELIKTTQAEIVKPYIEEAKMKLADDAKNLEKAKEFIVKSDKSGQAMSASYLATRDEIRFLLDEMTVLQNKIRSSASRGTRLLAPIYVNDKPISPKKRTVLVTGFMSGLILGLLMALCISLFSNLKRVSSRVL